MPIKFTNYREIFKIEAALWTQVAATPGLSFEDSVARADCFVEALRERYPTGEEDGDGNQNPLEDWSGNKVG